MDNKPITLFISYAPEDDLLCKKLEVHLKLLQRQNLLSTWHNRQIIPGENWPREVKEQLESAKIILLLISADFVASDYCYGNEMHRSLERHKTGDAQVIPILLRPGDWEIAPFAHLSMLPQNGEPITSWSDQELAFKDISMQLRKLITNLQRNQQASIAEQEHKNVAPEHNTLYTSPALLQFRHHQKRVSELKDIHNMLHEIEVQLEGLSATIQLFRQGEKDEPRAVSRRVAMFPRREIKQSTFDFNILEIIWRQTVLKIDNLAFFASEVIQVLEDEHFSFDSSIIRGAPWIKDLFILQRAFEEGIRDQSVNTIVNISSEILIKCRAHLYRIDKRLLEAAKELDISSNFLTEGSI